MSRRPVSIWIHERLERARLLTLAGAVGLIPVSAFAATFTWGIIHGVVGFVNSFGIGASDTAVWTISAVLLVTVFVWELASKWQRTTHAGLTGHEESFADRMMMEAAQSSSSFGEFMLRREAAFWAWILFIMFIGPQLLCLSVALFRQSRALKRLDDNAAERVLSTMMKGQSRLPLDEIQERFQPKSQTELIGGLTALDGVVLIGAESESPALTVAPRLNEDYKDWLAARRERQAAL